MKKLQIFFLNIFGFLSTHEEIGRKRITDTDIALALMGQKKEAIDKISQRLGVPLAFDGNDKVYVTMDGTSRVFDVVIGTATIPVSKGIREPRQDVIAEINIRYNSHKQLHMDSFYACVIPTDSMLYSFEKNRGNNESFIKISYR